ncbi:hypothetical protein BpHYR1_039037 [Brachionus plicatilis]|uniref:Uncharacterized protein n=1 Tax=Brachionus plicatilis TaxID=10195 RepID=A0A3M7R445_BRAPC|nr:hypothetical protein BpHYR1_039037 [Brachionus plicatilis]
MAKGYKLQINCTYFVLRLFLDSSSTIPAGKERVRVEEKSRKKNVQTGCWNGRKYMWPDFKKKLKYLISFSLIFAL